MTVAEQAQVFAAMAACGAMVGAAADVLGVLLGGGFLHLRDSMLGVMAAWGMILTGLRMETEVFRWYTFLGMLLGGGLYRATIGTIVRKLLIVVRSFVKKGGFMPKKSRSDAGKVREGANV